MRDAEVSLIGVHPRLDVLLSEIAYLAGRYARFHPANAGDISQVLDDEVTFHLKERFATTASHWVEVERHHELQELRADGRSDYSSEGISDVRFHEIIRELSGRSLIVTSTGSDIPYLDRLLGEGDLSSQWNVLEVEASGRRIRILFGNKQFGTIPSIEIHAHLMGNAIHAKAAGASAGVVHAHTQSIVSLGRHPLIAGSFERFNAAIYTAVEGLIRDYPELIGVVEYHRSGSAELVLATLYPFLQHRAVVWMGHGVVVRSESIKRAYAHIAYADWCARAALESLDTGALDLPEYETRHFLQTRGLLDAYQSLRGAVEG